MSLKELGVNYRPLTPERFLLIATRLETVTLDLYKKRDGLGSIRQTGRLDNEGLPTYAMVVNRGQNHFQRVLTVIHEAVHVDWEEGLFESEYAMDRFCKMSPEQQAMVYFDKRFGEHERMVEEEAKRFHKGNFKLASDVFNYFIGYTTPKP